LDETQGTKILILVYVSEKGSEVSKRLLQDTCFHSMIKWMAMERAENAAHLC